MNNKTYSVFNAMIDIIASPGKALDEIRPHTSWLWWPLLISILLAVGMFAYYYNWVDFPWLVEDTIRQLPAENRAESAEAIRKFMTQGRTMWATLIAVVVMSFIIYAILAVYLHLVNKITSGAEIGFGQWFSFSVWVSFVNIFGSIAALLVILMADSNQLASTRLQPLSFNSLLLQASPDDTWYTWANSLSLITIWTIFLSAIGFGRWTGASTTKSWVIAALPWVLIFGIWAATKLR
jgi:Yip1 domain